MQIFLEYDPGRLLISRPSLDRIKRAESFLARKAQQFEERVLNPSPIYLEEVVRSLSRNELPSYKALKRVAAGSLPDLIAKPDGDNLLVRFIKHIVEIGSAVLYKALLLGYLRLGHHKGAISESVRTALVRAKAKLPRRWIDRIDQFGLLELPAGRKLASIAINSGGHQPLDVFEAAGLSRGILLGGGFALNAFIEVCEEVAKGHNNERLSRFLATLPDANAVAQDGRKLLVSNALVSVAKALLQPYIQVEPTDEIKRQIIETLIRLYGDPRLKAAAWSGVDQDLLGVMYRWLTEESFELLMEVLNSSNQSDQWKAREKFWRRYIKKGYIKEAWVAFGPDAKRQAEKLIKTQKLRSKGSFGVLEQSQIQGHHSVLFMRIGDLTISEWTHDGKVRFYRSRNNDKPVLYRLRYDPDLIKRDRVADHFKVHLGYWQADVESYIRDITGIRLS
ncbi:MAG: hypothetical protein EBS54_01750 [Betaproteobacteria bacterium]|nr:hypothetical protein [Betaproteobacteria bacterium]NDE53848.1 hypothetical protein [Actinomycetota bacterium]